MTPLAGRFEDAEHVLPLRVYYEDTDAAGIVYYANYLKFAERARSDLLRLLDVNQSEMARDQGLAFAVSECHVRYRKPAKLDDLLEVRSRLVALGGASLRAEQAIRRDGEPVADLDVRVACLRLDGRPARIPGALRAALEPYCHGRQRG